MRSIQTSKGGVYHFVVERTVGGYKRYMSKDNYIKVPRKKMYGTACGTKPYVPGPFIQGVRDPYEGYFNLDDERIGTHEVTCKHCLRLMGLTSTPKTVFYVVRNKKTGLFTSSKPKCNDRTTEHISDAVMHKQKFGAMDAASIWIFVDSNGHEYTSKEYYALTSDNKRLLRPWTKYSQPNPLYAVHKVEMSLGDEVKFEPRQTDKLY